MDYSVIGTKIREMRKVVGLTQGDLAEGICTQALISRIEKGDIYPSATALYQIAVKLGVDINYFFEIGTTPRLDYIREVERQLKYLRDTWNYKGMIEVVKTEEKNPLFYKDYDKLQLLYWHKAIYLYEEKKETESAFTLLHKAYNLTAHPKKAMSEREMQILSSIGTFHASLHHHEEALDYYHQVEIAMKTTVQLQEKVIKTKLFYGMARILTRCGRLEESTDYCLKAIKWCLEEELLWGIGELHYQIGYNYELMNDMEKALFYMERAFHMFKLRDEQVHIDFVEKKMEKLRQQGEAEA
ncbi:helix-turn-helix domain-containing protein [Rossellomorea vietnamensis]|uniref:helix-turn-helix domain-containing protein n=1 Tax=Rossellomorea vietnamensis TaxID=218284 RepID=UPI001CCE4A40|nr:helix-turn-helix domain-containing protein [Rossellomorea vietnamensis]MCA0150433.1 helix-turn-helix domain-containing protein [Rossellomorea vietnamensis]